MLKLNYFLLLASFVLFTNLASYGSMLADDSAQSYVPLEIAHFKIGGALRYKYNLSTWKKEQIRRGGDLGFNMFRIHTDASFQRFDFHAEYRFYFRSSGGNFLKNGFLVYHVNDRTRLVGGLISNPFGNGPYNSHSYFNNIPYYVGFEDKFSMGLSFEQRYRRLIYTLAFFKNAVVLDFGDRSTIDPHRMSYDVGGRNKEVNQGNIRAEYLLDKYKRVGFSAMLGGVYNVPTAKMGSRRALAIHSDLYMGRFNLKLQSMTYDYQLADSVQYKSTVEIASYGSSHPIAKTAFIHTASCAYSFPLHLGAFTSFSIYENYSYMDKKQQGYADTQMNVVGCTFSSPHILAQVDWACGVNHPSFGADMKHGLAVGQQHGTWQRQLNFNLCYYF